MSSTYDDIEARCKVDYAHLSMWLACGGSLLYGLRLAVTGSPMTYAFIFGLLGVCGLITFLPLSRVVNNDIRFRGFFLVLPAVNALLIWWYLAIDRSLAGAYPVIIFSILIYMSAIFTANVIVAIGGALMVGCFTLGLFDYKLDFISYFMICFLCSINISACSWLAFGRIRHNKAIYKMYKRAEFLLGQSSDILIAINSDRVVEYQSSSIDVMLGYGSQQLLGTSLDKIIHPGDITKAQRWHNDLLSLPMGEVSRIEMRLRRADGGWSPTEIVGINRHGDHVLEAVVLNVRDIGTKKDLEERLALQTLSDSLTGLANRILFRDRVVHAMERGRRSASTVALLLVDLDDFKLVNDAVGHARGDDLLVTIAERLRACTRPSDTLARLDGDEFAILVEDRIDEMTAVSLGERILEVIRPPIRVGTRDISLTASIGIAVVKAGVYGAHDAEELLRDADLALYAAKSTGHDRCVLFDPAMHVEVLREAEQRAELETAVAEEQFVVQYQPIVDLPTLKLIGIEALVRWLHPTRGLIGPGEFIPLAEATGLIVPLGRWVLQQSCAQTVRWQQLAKECEFLRISVNLSARQFQYSGLVDDVASVLASTGIPPHTVVLEITESLLMLDTEATVATLQRLKSLGVRLAIDDFGTGYSSLSYLRRFPVDIIKIDRSFVDGIATESEDATLTEAVVSLGRSLRLQTVAEGIETQEQSTRLAELGCDYGQGFLFARPLGAEAIGPMLSHNQ